MKQNNKDTNNGLKNERIKSRIVSHIMALVSIMWFAPVYFMLINSFKPFKSVILDTASFPKGLYLENFKDVWEMTNFSNLLLNSIFITGFSVLGIVLAASMAGYKLARWNSRWNRLITFYFILTLIIPFQAIMIPLVKTMKELSLIDKRIGLILVYIALGSPLAIFLYQAAVKAIPISLEESAKIDGGGPFTIFFKIIFPLLKPITSTVIILQSLYIWNDFLLPLITLQSENKKTIPLGISAAFFGQYSNKWNLGITAMLSASIPMIVIYVIMQKYILKGIVSGATKG